MASFIIGNLVLGAVPLLAFIGLFLLARSMWLAWRQFLFDSKLEWRVFEIRIPREVAQTARAMEQFLLAISTMGEQAGTFVAKWRDGSHSIPIVTFEMASLNGQVHFFMRCEKGRSELIRSAFLSYYPTVEVAEVDDYMKSLPPTMADLKAQGNRFFGTDIQLTRESAYPIKSYEDFASPNEDDVFDPMSVFLEVFGKMRAEESLIVQINVSPIDGKTWVESGKEVLKKLKEGEKKEGEDTPQFRFRTPGEELVLKAVERNLSKPAFECVVRLAYFAPTAIFSDGFPRRGVLGAFNQYAANDMNGFRPNFDTFSYADFWHYPFVLPSMRANLRSQQIWQHLISREMGTDVYGGKMTLTHPLRPMTIVPCVLNTESLATLFHPPTKVVLTAPFTARVESKKAGAPSGLPIFAQEDVLKDYQ